MKRTIGLWLYLWFVTTGVMADPAKADPPLSPEAVMEDSEPLVNDSGWHYGDSLYETNHSPVTVQVHLTLPPSKAVNCSWKFTDVILTPGQRAYVGWVTNESNGGSWSYNANDPTLTIVHDLSAATMAPASSGSDPSVDMGDASPQPTPTPAPFYYFALGAGTARLSNGFGTEGNPWVDNGNATLANGYGTSYTPSMALQLIVGFDLDDHWSANLSFESYYFFTAQASTNNEINLFPSLRYTFDSGWLTPYVNAGAGINFNNSSYPNGSTGVDSDGNQVANYNSVSVTNPVLSVGAGFLIRISATISVYLQAQYEEVLTAQGNFSYFPLTLGIQIP